MSVITIDCFMNHNSTWTGSGSITAEIWMGDEDGVPSDTVVPEGVTTDGSDIVALELVLATKLDSVLVAVVVATLNSTLPSSATFSIFVCLLLPKPGRGMNFVHQSAIRRPRSIKRCLRMKSTTRMKNMNAERMRIRSSQSAFSRAVMRCLEVTISVLRVSWVCDVARNVEVDSSTELDEFRVSIEE